MQAAVKTARPGELAAEAQPVVERGQPALLIGQTKHAQLVVLRTKYHGEEALRFSVELLHKWRPSEGYLYVTGSRITYDPTFSPKRTKDAFDLVRAKAPGLSVQRMGFKWVWCGTLLLDAGASKYRLDPVWMKKDEVTPDNHITGHRGDPCTGLGGGRPSKSARLYEDWVVLAINHFGQARQMVTQSTENLPTRPAGEQEASATSAAGAPAALNGQSASGPAPQAILNAPAAPLPPATATVVNSKEAAGDAAAYSGDLYAALQDYEAALHALPAEGPPPNVEQRLEEKTIKLVLRMNPRPAIPQEAMRHQAYALAAVRMAGTQGPGDLENAIVEFNKVLRLAPWWGGAYKNLAMVLEKEHRYAAAACYLQLYLLATPGAPDTQSIQIEVYSLQYKARHQAGD